MDPLRSRVLQLECLAHSGVENSAQGAIPGIHQLCRHPQILIRPSGIRFLRTADQGLQRRTDVEVSQIAIEPRDDIGQVLDERPESLLGLAQVRSLIPHLFFECGRLPFETLDRTIVEHERGCHLGKRRRNLAVRRREASCLIDEAEQTRHAAIHCDRREECASYDRSRRSGQIAVAQIIREEGTVLDGRSNGETSKRQRHFRWLIEWEARVGNRDFEVLVVCGPNGDQSCICADDGPAGRENLPGRVSESTPLFSENTALFNGTCGQPRRGDLPARLPAALTRSAWSAR